MVESGIVLDDFYASIITPTVKNVSNSPHDVNNYRLASIISALAKKLGSLVDIHYGHLFYFHDNQFGFCDRGGCSKAIFAFTNTVRYFMNRHSNVYLAALDVTKAFDRVNQCFATFVRMWFSFEIGKRVLPVVQKCEKLYFMGK